MAEYATEQKKMLSHFLTENSEHAYTIEELMAGMQARYGNHVPGKSTVYRLMTHLVEEGTVKRFVKGHSRTFLYQITAGDHCHSHLHLKCMDCGRLIHLDNQLSDTLLDKIRSCSDFTVSEEETVLFGECSDCHQHKKTLHGGSHD